MTDPNRQQLERYQPHHPGPALPLRRCQRGRPAHPGRLRLRPRLPLHCRRAGRGRPGNQRHPLAPGAGGLQRGEPDTADCVRDPDLSLDCPACGVSLYDPGLGHATGPSAGTCGHDLVLTRIGRQRHGAGRPAAGYGCLRLRRPGMTPAAGCGGSLIGTTATGWTNPSGPDSPATAPPGPRKRPGGNSFAKEVPNAP